MTLDQQMLKNMVSLVNAIETNDLNKTKEMCNKFSEECNQGGTLAEGSLFMYLRNILFFKRYEQLNDCFYYTIENLNLLHEHNIHLYFAIRFLLATLPPEANVRAGFGLTELIEAMENNPYMVNSLTFEDFNQLISTCICRNELGLMNKVNDMMNNQQKNFIEQDNEKQEVYL